MPTVSLVANGDTDSNSKLPYVQGKHYYPETLWKIITKYSTGPWVDYNWPIGNLLVNWSISGVGEKKSDQSTNIPNWPMGHNTSSSNEFV